MKSRSLILGTLGALALPLLFIASPAEASDRGLFRCDSDRFVRRGHVSHRFPVVTHRHDRHGPRALACGCRQVWRSGHYKTVRDAVRDRGYYDRVWVPARFGTRICFGRRVSFQISSGYYKKIYRPGRVRYVSRQVWVPAAYVLSHRCRTHFHG